MNRTVDVIIFGASGFTGKHCIPIIHKLTQSKENQFTWAIAGRNERKLRFVLQEYSCKLGASLDHIEIVVADVNEESSLIRMASMARCIINCCGPFSLYGETVVKICIENGTHHIDVSAEMQYMKLIQLKYNEKAKKNHVYVASACGILSLPNDIATVHMQKKYPEIVFNSVESFLKIEVKGDTNPSPILNVTTLDSSIHVLKEIRKLQKIRSSFFPDKIPELTPILKTRIFPYKSEVLNGWILPLPITDEFVLEQTQRYLYETRNQRPIQIRTYCILDSFRILIKFFLLGILFKILLCFSCGGKLIRKYPGVFSGGLFSNTEPSEQKIESTHYKYTVVGKGWEKSLENESLLVENQKITQEIVATIQGTNPGYGTTCVCLVLGALILLKEPEKLPKEGGVYTPGILFEDTSIIQQLNENNIKICMKSKSEL